MFVLKYIHQASVPSSPRFSFFSIHRLILAAPDTQTICTSDLKELTLTSLQGICAVYLQLGSSCIDAADTSSWLSNTSINLQTHTRKTLFYTSIFRPHFFSCNMFFWFDRTPYHHIIFSHHRESVFWFSGWVCVFLMKLFGNRVQRHKTKPNQTSTTKKNT